MELRQDVFVFVCAGEESLRVGADRDDLANSLHSVYRTSAPVRV